MLKRTACIITSSISFFFLLMPRPLSSTLFPYTTLFRSRRQAGGRPRPNPVDRRSPHVPQGARRRYQDRPGDQPQEPRSEEHTSELQSRFDLVCRLLLEKKNAINPDLHVSALMRSKEYIS